MGLPRHHGRDLFAVSRRITSPAPAGRVAPDIWGAAAPASDLRRGAVPWWRCMGASLAVRPGQGARRRAACRHGAQIAPAWKPRSALRQRRWILTVHRRGSRETDLSAYRHRVRSARRRQEGGAWSSKGVRSSFMKPRRPDARMWRQGNQRRSWSRDQADWQRRTRIATRCPALRILGVCAPVGVHPLSFLNDLSRPSTPSNPRSFGPSCRCAAARTTPLIGVPLRVFALRWRGRPGRL